jgi:hypothetical protein
MGYRAIKTTGKRMRKKEKGRVTERERKKREGKKENCGDGERKKEIERKVENERRKKNPNKNLTSKMICSVSNCRLHLRHINVK